jgi:predicted 2-oxoglutarate/Fe(II)-dependent dioxygenase YbiX
MISVYSLYCNTSVLIAEAERVCADPAIPQVEWQAGAVGGHDAVVTSHRTSLLLEASLAGSVDSQFAEALNHVHREVEDAVWHYRTRHNVYAEYSEGYLINKYGAGGEYKPHPDAGKDMRRIISMVAFLNTPEDGGDLYFPVFDVTVKAIAGTAVLFPSTQPWIHAALPVKSTSVPKYSLVSWYAKN